MMFFLTLLFSVSNCFAEEVLDIVPVTQSNMISLDPINFKVKEDQNKKSLLLSGKIYKKNVSVVFKDKYISVGEAVPLEFSVYVDMTANKSQLVTFVLIDRDGVINREVSSVSIVNAQR